MKPILALTGLTVTLCAMAVAQDSADRIVVPARDSSHPRVVRCDLMNGSITVKTHSGNDVIVEGPEGHREPPRADGMRRIGGSTRGIEVQEQDNAITVRGPGGNQSVVITVPVDTSLRLKTLMGPITVDGVHGEVDAHTLNGQMTLTDISGTVTADSQNGEIKVTMNQVDASKPLAFSSLNGTVDVTLPADLKANLTVKTDHGSMFSDFDITLGGSRATTEKNNTKDGRFRIRMDNTIHGTINGGGADLTLRTLNGSVYIRKRK